MAHGDGLLSEGLGFHLIRKIFHSPTAQKLFRLVPPQLGIGFGFAWSRSNRKKIYHLNTGYMGEDKEHMVIFAKRYVQTHDDIDFFIFGHRHIELNLQINKRSRVVILGDFVSLFSYGAFDGENFSLENF